MERDKQVIQCAAALPGEAVQVNVLMHFYNAYPIERSLLKCLLKQEAAQFLNHFNQDL